MIELCPEEQAKSAGFDLTRLHDALALCRRSVESGNISGMALAVARHGELVVSEQWLPVAMPKPAVWLLASITKPLVAAAFCRLLDEGQVALDDPISEHLPEFGDGDRGKVTALHLLTHTSGLPDMLPENLELRRRHAPLSEFVRLTFSTPLLFTPGTRISYQSCGITLLGELVERKAGKPCREVLASSWFQPLGLKQISLGLDPALRSRVVPANLDASQEKGNWDWNSEYWRGFGAPWGGMFSTASDLALLLQSFFTGGPTPGPLSDAGLKAMTRCHTDGMASLPAEERSRQRWGLGWRVKGPRAEFFGDLTSDRAFGHGGATGTAAWCDPATGVSCALLTNQPGSSRFLGRVSSAVAAAVQDRTW